MGKRTAAFSIALCLTASLAVAQAPDSPVTPFGSVPGMTGLILEATGFGFIVGGGAASSVDLGAALVLMQIAPIASSAGAWVTTDFMAKTGDFWAKQGVAFDSSPYIKTSRTLAITTTAFAAGALLVPIALDDTAGAIISIVCAGVSVCVDLYGLYIPRLGWTKAINEAILASGIDWKAAKK
jgi:hypothetical protein